MRAIAENPLVEGTVAINRWISEPPDYEVVATREIVLTKSGAQGNYFRGQSRDYVRVARGETSYKSVGTTESVSLRRPQSA